MYYVSRWKSFGALTVRGSTHMSSRYMIPILQTRSRILRTNALEFDCRHSIQNHRENSCIATNSYHSFRDILAAYSSSLRARKFWLTDRHLNWVPNYGSRGLRSNKDATEIVLQHFTKIFSDPDHRNFSNPCRLAVQAVQTRTLPWTASLLVLWNCLPLDLVELPRLVYFTHVALLQS